MLLVASHNTMMKIKLKTEEVSIIFSVQEKLLKLFNKFAIKNGLGNFDSFYPKQ